MIRRRAVGRPVELCFIAGTLGRGGAERQLLYMLTAAQDLPVRSRLLCLTRAEALEDEVRSLGITPEYVGDQESRAARLSRIVQSLRARPADIVQAAHFYTNLYAGVAARVTGAVSMGAIRNDLSSEMWGNRPFGRAHLHAPHYLAANSAGAREQAVAYGRSSSRVFLLENVVDTARFSRSRDYARAAGPGRDERPPGRSAIHLLFAGRLVPQKRPDRFLRLVSELRERAPDVEVRARLVGDGRLRAELERMRGDLGLAEKDAEIVGELSDLGPSFEWADLLILPSDFEGTPNVVLEAMASALPVVAFDVGGVAAILPRQAGVLVRPQDERMLLESTMTLIRDETKRRAVGAFAREWVEAHHGLGTLSRRLGRMYRLMLQPTRELSGDSHAGLAG
jgi:glycosyltransferase involved in cell wall biosynthesis